MKIAISFPCRCVDDSTSLDPLGGGCQFLECHKFLTFFVSKYSSSILANKVNNLITSKTTPERIKKSATCSISTGRGYRKDHPTGLAIIDITSGPVITQIRDAIQVYCQREICPISYPTCLQMGPISDEPQ